MSRATPQVGQTGTTGRLGARGNAWAVGKREALFMAAGALLYGLLGWATAGLRIPGPFDLWIRPAVAIPLFAGVAFGPVVGFATGFAGNLFIDALTGPVYWNWAVGNGLMGLVAGLAWSRIYRLGSTRSLFTAVVWSVLGVLVGMAFPAITDLWVRPDVVKNAQDAWAEYFAVSISNSIAAVVIVPLLAVAYANLRSPVADEQSP